MIGLDREYCELAKIVLIDDDGHATEAGVRVMIREEVDYAIDHDMREALLAAIADPEDRWHDEAVLRLTA